MADHIPITADANMDALTDAVEDTVEFFACDRVTTERVHSRYNVLADERDGVRRLHHQDWTTLLETAAENGVVDVDMFGIALPD